MSKAQGALRWRCHCPRTFRSAEVEVRSYAELAAFTTLDGSEIREWAGPVSAPAQNQSLAEANDPCGRRDDRALSPHHRGAVPDRRGPGATADRRRGAVRGRGRLRADSARSQTQAVQRWRAAVAGSMRLCARVL